MDFIMELIHLSLMLLTSLVPLSFLGIPAYLTLWSLITTLTLGTGIITRVDIMVFVSKYRLLRITAYRLLKIIAYLRTAWNLPRSFTRVQRPGSNMTANMLHAFKHKPITTMLRLAPALWNLSRAYRQPDERKRAYTQALMTIASFVADHTGLDDGELISSVVTGANTKIAPLVDFFMKFGKSTPQGTAHQFSFDPSKGLKLLAFSLSVFGAGTAVTTSAFSWFSKCLNEATKNTKNFDYIYKSFMDFFSTDEEELELRSKVSEMSDLITEIRASSFAEKLEKVTQLPQIIKDARGVLARAEKNPALKATSVLRSLYAHIDKLEELLVALKIAQDYRATIRPLPVRRHFFGLPASGKTRFVQEELVPAMIKRMGLTSSGPREVYTFNPATKHMPGYTGQKFFLVDEFLAQQSQDPILDVFNGLATEQGTTMDGASIELKNMRPLHEFFITMSNFPGLVGQPNEAHKRAFTDAVNSRLTPVYVHFPEFNPDVKRDRQGARTLCMHNVATDFVVPDNQQACPNGEHGQPIADRQAFIAGLYDEMTAEWNTNHADWERRLAAYDANEQDRQNLHQVQDIPALIILPPGVDPLTFNVPFRFMNFEDYLTNPGNIQLGVELPFINLPDGDRSADWFPLIHDFRQSTDIEQDIIGFHTNGIPYGNTGDIEQTALHIKGKDAAEISQSFLQLGISLTAEEIRRIKAASRSDRPAIHRAFVDGLTAIFTRNDLDVDAIKLVDLGVVYKRLSLAAAAGRPFDVWLVVFTAYGLTESLVWGPTNGFQRFAQKQFYEGTDLQTLQPGDFFAGKHNGFAPVTELFTYIVIAYAAYKAASWLAGVFTPSNEPDGVAVSPNTSSESLSNPKVVASLLAMYKIDPEEGLIRHEKGGSWVYDYQTRDWVRRGDIGELSYARLRKANKDFANNRRQESTDAGLMKKRRPAATTTEESCEYDEIIDDVLAAQTGNDDVKDVQYINAVVEQTLLNKASRDSCISACEEARVICSNDTQYLFGMRIKGGYIICPAHLSKGKETSIRVAYKDSTYNAIIKHEDNVHDIMLLLITDKTYPQARDIRNFFATEDNITRERSGGLVLPTSRKMTTVFYGILSWDIEGRYSTCGSLKKHIARLNFATDNSITAPGMCGSPLIINNEKRNSSLISGMHSFVGHGQSYSACAILTREIIDELLTEHQMALTAFTIDKIGSKSVASEIMKTLTNPSTDAKNPFPENDRITYIGNYKGAFIASSRSTAYTATNLDSADAPKIPSIRPPQSFDREVKAQWPENPFGRKDRGYLQIKKYVVTDRKFDPETMERVRRGLLQHYRDLAQDGEIRVLKNQEVWNGVKSGPLETVKGLDMGTSPGYAYKKLFNLKKKGDIFELDGIYKVRDSPAGRYLMSYLDHVKCGGEQLYWPFCASMKDELLPAHKVLQNGKCRLFSLCCLNQLAVDKKYLGWCVGFAKNHLHETHMTVGMDPHMDFHDLYQRLQRHPRLLAGDYKGWDGSIPRFVQTNAVSIISDLAAEHLEQSEHKILREALDHSVDRLEVYEGTFYDLQGSMASGIWLTNFLNSVKNATARLYAICQELKEKHGLLPDLSEVFCNVELADHGDDFLDSVSDRYAELGIDYFSLQRQLKKIGLTITPATKDGDETAYVSFEESSFISRFPRYVGDRIVGALKKESIEQQLYFQREMTREEREQVLDSVLLEASAWGEEYFQSIRPRVMEVRSHFGIAARFVPSYEESVAILYQKSGQARCLGTSKPKGMLDSDFVSEIKSSSATTAQHNSGSHPNNDQTPSNQQNKMKFFMACMTCSKTADVAPGYKAKFGPSCEIFVGSSSIPTLEEIDAFIETLDIDCKMHIEDTIDHQRDINACGKLFFDMTFPSHDLSKFSDAERTGYQLFFFEGVGGILWERGLYHHYKKNKHHIQHYTLPSWHEWIRNKRIPRPEDSFVLDPAQVKEIVCDAITCMKRKMPKTTKLERAQKILNDFKTGSPFLDVYPPKVKALYKSLLEDIVKVAPPQKVTVYEVDGSKFTSFQKYVRFLVNSKGTKNCPECSAALPSHKDGCIGTMIGQCAYCPTVNDDLQKLENHVINSHAGMQVEWRLIKNATAHESGVQDQKAGALPHQSVNLPVPTLTGSGMAQGNHVLASAGTVPSAAMALPGYIADLESLSKQYTEIQYISLPSTTIRSTTIGKYGYADLVAMNPAARTRSGFHKYIAGPMDLQILIFGAASKTGSVIFAWVPDVTQDYTIQDAMQYGNWVSVTFNTQGTASLSLNNADDAFRPREIFSSTVRATKTPGVIIIVQEPVSSTLGPGEAQVNMIISSRFTEQTFLTYPKLELLGELPTAVTGFTAPIPLSQLITGDEVSFRLDGEFVVPSRLNTSVIDCQPGIPWTSDNVNDIEGTGNLPKGYGNGKFQAIWNTNNEVEVYYTYGYSVDTNSLKLATNILGDNHYADIVISGQEGDTVKSRYYFENGVGRQVLKAYWDEEPQPTLAKIARHLNDITNSQLIEAFAPGPNPPLIRNLQGLKRFTLKLFGPGKATSPPAWFVDASIATKWPVLGESVEEILLRQYVESTVSGNALVTLSLGSSDFEILYERDNRTFWYNGASAYGVLDWDVSDITITNVRSAGNRTVPKRSTIDPFISLVINRGSATYHQASAAMAMIFAGSSTANSMMGNMTTGIGAKKNRELTEELFNLQMDFTAAQAALNREMFRGESALARQHATDMIDQAGDLAKEVTTLNKSLGNANMTSQKNPMAYASVDGGSTTNKNQNFVDSGAPVEGKGASMLYKGIGKNAEPQPSRNPGVGAVGGPQSYDLSAGINEAESLKVDSLPDKGSKVPTKSKTSYEGSFVSGGTQSGSASAGLSASQDAELAQADIDEAASKEYYSVSSAGTKPKQD